MTGPAYSPTPEQQHAVDMFRSGQNTVIEALAGTGKTSTLQFIANSAGRRSRGLYVAFNKAIATEAGRKFAGTGVVSKTMHSLAFAEFGAPMRHRLNDRRTMRWNEKAKHLGITSKMMFPSGHGAAVGGLPIQTLVKMTSEALTAFMRSAEDEITEEMVPWGPDLIGLNDDLTGEVRAAIVGYARTYWEDLIDPDGQLRYDHDAYFKQWALSRPTLPYDYIMLDEAQDSDPITVQVLMNQDVQVVTVGDNFQSIYGWRGATNAMDRFDGVRTSLTQSFRFGDEIAEYANRWLSLMHAPLRLQGMPGRRSSVFRATKRMPEAILTRSNGRAIQELVEAQERGYETGIAGEKKAKEMRGLAQASLDLQREGKTHHPELRDYNSWFDFVEYAMSDDGEEYRPLVEVIEKYTARGVVRAIDACVPTDEAQVTVSTAHVSKGLEWLQVQIAEDFHPPRRSAIGGGQPIPAEEARLAYVASTRAQRHLDPRGLEWLDGYLAEGGWVASSEPATAHVDNGGAAAPAITATEKVPYGA